MSNKQRTNSWVATLPTLTSEEDQMALAAFKSTVKAINEQNALAEKWRKRFNKNCEEVGLPRYRVSIRARGPVNGYKYGYGGYLKIAGGSRFDVYIHERR
jgi:hypothetical protein